MLETCLYTYCQRPFSCIIIINELESGMMLLQKFILVCFEFYMNSIKPSSYDINNGTKSYIKIFEFLTWYDCGP